MSHTDSSPGNHTPETSGVAAPGETASSTSRELVLDGLSVEEDIVLLNRYLSSPDTWRSSSISSASSPPASRSGTSSRSLRGLVRSSLADYLPYLLAATSEPIRQRLVLSSASYAARELSGNGGCS